MRRSALEATAYHEAGHAVAAIFKAIRFKYVTIDPDGVAGSAGHVLFWRRKPKTLEQLFADGVVAMAGEAAQRRFAPRSVRLHHGGSDRTQVVDLALRSCGAAAEAELLTQLWDLQARSLIDLRWLQVEQVARTLLDRRRLTSAEVKEIVMARQSA